MAAVNCIVRRKLIEVFPTSSNSLSFANVKNFSRPLSTVLPLQQSSDKRAGGGSKKCGDTTNSKLSPSSTPVKLCSRNFHRQNASQLHIQLTGPHGILLEALQKRYRIPDSKYEDNIHQEDVNIPDELRRLKTSLKWLFEVWPGTNSKSYRALASAKHGLQQEFDGDNDDDEETNEKKKTKGKGIAPMTPTEQQLHDTVEYLKHKQIAIRRLVRLPWLLTCDLKVLEERVERVKRILGVKDFKVAVSFTNLNETKLYEIAAVWRRDRLNTDEEEIKFENRVQWMSHRLSCHNEDVSDMMAKNPGLSTFPLESISKMLKCLLEEDCEMQLAKPDAIISDPWVFSNSMKMFEDRAKILRDNGIGEVKPWVFRTPERLFNRFLQNRIEKRKLLGDNKDITGFLQEKLHYRSGNEVTAMLERVPRLQRATVIKLNDMIEFLLSEGFSLEEIKETPRILAHSVGTISKRLQEVSAVTKKPIGNLQMLCRTSNEYRSILDKMQRRHQTAKPVDAK